MNWLEQLTAAWNNYADRHQEWNERDKSVAHEAYMTAWAELMTRRYTNG